MSDGQRKLPKTFIPKRWKIKLKSYTMSYKRDVAKFAQERSIKLATSRIGLDTRREWIRSTREITARAPTKKSLMEADQNQ